MKVSTQVLEVLDRAEINGSALTLVGTLDRPLYTKTNEVLEAAGGKWNRKLKAHIFDGDAGEAIEAIILTGEFSRTKQDFGQFDSPPDVVARVMRLASIAAGMAVLEPSAGIGNIARAAEAAGGRVTAVEIDTKRACALEGIPHIEVHIDDFLSIEPVSTFDRVVMNPPFAKQDDIRHVLHAAKFLKPGGRLVSVMSASVMFRVNRLTAEFRDAVAAWNGTMEALPAGAFTASGTSVNACVVAFGA